MIERFVSAVRTLARTPAAVLGDPSSRGLRADAADAVRLQIDCMQQELTPAQRGALHRLEELLDAEEGDPTGILAAATDAARMLGIEP
jgi:hypothetical protein